MNQIAGIVLLAAVLTACSTPTSTMITTTSSTVPATAAAAAILAPAGKLRAAINFGNTMLAVKDSASGEPRGVSVDLARELARRLGVPIELVLYTVAGKVVDGLKAGEWDMGFVAIDPMRAAGVRYLAEFIEEMKASGFVATALKRHGIEGVTVAPPASR